MLKLTVDSTRYTAYLYLVEIKPGAAVTQIKCEGPKGGTVVLDFDKDGRLLGVELIGASVLLPLEHLPPRTNGEINS